MSRMIAQPHADLPAGQRRRRVLGALTGLALLAGVVAGGWWWSHPTYFRDYGAGMSFTPLPVEKAAVHVAVAHPPVDARDAEAVVTLHSAEAHFAENSAAATATFAICQGTAIGSTHGDLADECDTVTPIEGDVEFASMRGSDQHLVMTITPTRSGRVVVDAVTLDYTLDRAGLWRRGQQTFGVDVTVTAR